MSLFFIAETLLSFVALILPLLLAVAFFTLYERHILAATQRRQGPNVVGFYGLFQAIADGLKLLLKESILPKSANTTIFLLSPIFTFGLAIAGWIVFPLGEGMVLLDFRLGLLYIFAISSLGVHTVIRAGWSSNSKYAFLGGLRSAAQRISYEVSLATTLLSIVIVAGTLNLTSLSDSQQGIWYIFPLLPRFILFFICALAETNRHPFDLPEAEAELVSGYNVEYSAIGFALFFLAEYSNIILISALTALLFIGGWQPIENGPLILLSVFTGILAFYAPTVWFALKVIIFTTLFVLIRARLPRYRYDQLRRLGWKVFLPLALSFVLRYAALLLSFNGVAQIRV